jgi:hypothetical protein
MCLRYLPAPCKHICPDPPATNLQEEGAEVYEYRIEISLGTNIDRHPFRERVPKIPFHCRKDLKYWILDRLGAVKI